MAYIINRFDGTRLVAIDDGVLDTSTPLGIVGRNYTGWGEVFNENFIFLLENFHGSNPPSRALSGQAWYDSSNKLLKVFNGVNWTAIGNASVAEIEPEITQGGLWLKTTTNQLYVNDGFSWKLVGPEAVENFEVTRLVSQTLKSITGVLVPVVVSYIDGQAISIFSNQAFTIDTNETPVSGFSILVKGLTFRADSSVAANLVGNADTATALQTARKINSVDFNGTEDITIKSSTTNFLNKGNYILGDDWDGTVETTWSIDATPENRIGKIVARDSNGAFSAEEITANFFRGDLNGNVTATSGNSSFDTITAVTVTAELIGNSSTATKLRSARTINTIPFDGTANITLPVPAETLVGSTLAPNILNSSLTSVGKLTDLEVDADGISILNDNSKLTISLDGLIPTIRSELTNNIKFALATGSAQSTQTDISFVSTTASGLSGPSLVADWNKEVPDNQKISLGIPENRWNNVYSNNLNSKDLKILTVSNANNSAQAVAFLGGITVAETVQGNVIGNVTGNLTGNVVGNVTGQASLNLLKAGDTMTGDITLNGDGLGTVWTTTSEAASIKYYDVSPFGSRLEFNTIGDGSEYFTFIHTYSDGSRVSLMKLDPSVGNTSLTVYGTITANNNITAPSFQGNGSNLTSLNASQLSSGIVPVGRLAGSYNIDINGRVQGNLTGNVTGNVNGNVTGASSLNVLKSGDTMSGDINWNLTGTGISWALNTDGASIRFYNAGDGDTSSRLEFNTSDNNNEYFRWTHTASGAGTYEVMKLLPNSFGNSMLTVQGDITSTRTISAASFGGNGSGLSNLVANSITSGTLPIGRLSGSYNINISGTAATATNATFSTNLSGGFVSASTGSFTGILNVSAGSGGGIKFPNDAFGGGGDTASITLESVGGERTRLRFRVTNDSGISATDDKAEFLVPDNDSLLVNGHVVLNASNYNNYAPTKTGGGASGSWPINITGNANTVNSITASQVVNALGYTPLSSVSTPSNQAGQPIFTGAGSNSGLRFPNDAYGGAFDTATITLETKGGEATRMTLRVTNDADDTIEFFTPARDGVKINNHTVLHAGNWQDYGPNRTGGGASGTWPISITGNANTVSTISAAQIVNALGYTPISSVAAASNQAGQPIYTGAGSGSGLRFPSNAYGGGGDTATVTLETKGGEATRLTLRVTNDADDTIEFFTPARDGVRANGHIVLHAGNWQDYGPNRTGGGASGTWPINITGNANTVSNISASQIVNALGFTPISSSAFGGGPVNATSGSFSGLLRVSAGSPQVSGIAFPNDAYGGSGDTATITLESVGGERTRLRFRVTNDASSSVRDEAEFLVPDNNGLLVNGNIVLHTGNINSFINAGNVKAWVRFRSNGSILSSLNVNSVSRLASGKYRLNIASGVFSSEYFAAAGMASDVDHFVSINTYSVGGATTTTRLDINTVDAASGNDVTSDSAETTVILVA